MTIGLVTTEERRRALLLEHCHGCRVRTEKGEPWDSVIAIHESCHGHHHCDADCCGECPVCGCGGIDAAIDDALESWEATLTEGTGADGE